MSLSKVLLEAANCVLVTRQRATDYWQALTDTESMCWTLFSRLLIACTNEVVCLVRSVDEAKNMRCSLLLALATFPYIMTLTAFKYVRVTKPLVCRFTMLYSHVHV